MKRLIVLSLASFLLVSCTATQSIPGIILVQTETGLERVEGGKSKKLPLPDGVTDLTPSPDGRYLVGQQGGQWVYFVVGEKQVHPLSQAQTPVIAWAPQSEALAVAEGGTLRIIDPKTRRERSFTVTDDTSIYDLSWLPNSALIAVSIGEWNKPGELLLLNVASGHLDSLGAVSYFPLPRWSHDSQVLALRNDHNQQGAAELYDLHERTREPLLSRFRLYDLVAAEDHHLDDQGFTLGPVYFAPDDQWLAFQYKAAGSNPRFVIGAIRKDGQQAHTWVLPFYPDLSPSDVLPRRPCEFAGWLTWTDQGALLRLDGPGCSDQMVLLSWPELTVKQTFTMPNPAGSERLFIAPDGSLALSHGRKTEWVSLDVKTKPPAATVNGIPLGWFSSK